MDEELIDQLRQVLGAHANAMRLYADLEKMKVANDDARSRGENDRYGEDDFSDLAKEIRSHAETITG